ncbi:MAG: hypothetical protein Q4F31_02950 [Eubacteriales bacterium]|nr:hypothetical protein [Eubacteriales bacterium]
MNKSFPRTEVGGVSLPRMIIGTNWLLGWSHTGAAADQGIKDRYQKPSDFYPILHEYLENGINAIMGPASDHELLVEAIHYTEDRDGKGFIIVDTPVVDVSDSLNGRIEAEKIIKKSAQIGSSFCLIHHVSVEQLINKGKREITRLPDYLTMIRENGLIPGCGAHMPEVILYCDANQYDVETYIQIFNCMGFMMQIEIENVARIINSAKHPVMTIKPMAAGRTTPYVGLTFNWNVIRNCDMVTVGANSALEAREDIEYSFAALEHRFPDVEGRGSSGKNQDVLKKVIDYDNAM